MIKQLPIPQQMFQFQLLSCSQVKCGILLLVERPRNGSCGAGGSLSGTQSRTYLSGVSGGNVFLMGAGFNWCGMNVAFTPFTRLLQCVRCQWGFVGVLFVAQSLLRDGYLLLAVRRPHIGMRFCNFQIWICHWWSHNECWMRMQMLPESVRT